MEGVAHAQSRSLSPWVWRAGHRTPGHWGGEPTNTRRHLDAFWAGELRLQPGWALRVLAAGYCLLFSKRTWCGFQDGEDAAVFALVWKGRLVDF